MADLPKAYMRVARNITGYWGTYLPSLELRIGTIGRREDGVFVREGHLSRFEGFDAARFGMLDDPGVDPTVVWTTKSVRMEVLTASADAPAVAASGSVRLNFDAANEAAIICNGPREQSFGDTLAVKQFMRHLRDEKLWDDELCVVTDLVWVDSAWICFSTERGQAAEIKAKAPLALPGDPVSALAALSSSATLEAGASHSGRTSSAFRFTLPSGGTPLFRAVKFRYPWYNPFKPKVDFVRGANEEFEEASFGDN